MRPPLTSVQSRSFEPRPRVRALVTLLGLAVFVGACGDQPLPAPPDETTADPASRAEARADDSVSVAFERAVVFLASDGDSTLVAPWIFRTRRLTTEEHRTRGTWLGREGSWEELTLEEDTTPASRTPWRILPGPTVRLVMGRNDALERLILRAGTRQAETTLGMLLAEWSGPSGETIRFHRGTLTLPAGQRDGFILDLTHPPAEAEDTPPDWIFVHGGDEFQAMFLEGTPVSEPRSPGAFRAWTRVAVREAIWPEIQVEWAEVRAFERARRDIPARWSVASPGEELTAELVVVGSHLTAGEGDSPLLPLDAFFEVTGEVRVEGESFQVTGVVRHRQR